MTRRAKRIKALHSKFPTLTIEELRKKERELFHKNGGGGKPPHGKRRNKTRRRFVLRVA